MKCFYISHQEQGCTEYSTQYYLLWCQLPVVSFTLFDRFVNLIHVPSATIATVDLWKQLDVLERGGERAVEKLEWKMPNSLSPNPRPGEKGGTLLSSPFFGTCVHYVGPFGPERADFIHSLICPGHLNTIRQNNGAHLHNPDKKFYQ